MTLITVKEVYEYYRATLEYGSSETMSDDDMYIECYYIEEYLSDAGTFLHEETLDILLEYELINEKIYKKTQELRRISEELEKNRELLNAEAIRTSPEWAKVISLADEILEDIEKFGLPRNISVDELYEFYKSTLKNGSSSELNNKDMYIEWYYAEEYLPKVEHFLHEDNINKLLDANFINQDIYKKSDMLRCISVEIIRRRPLHTGEAIRTSREWAKIISLADELLVEVEEYELSKLEMKN